MNERIRELMIEAGYAAPELAGRANKLVELIVKECARVAYECGPTVVNGSERQFNPVTYTGNQILMHFEIEMVDQLDEIEYCPRCGLEDSGTSCGIPDCGWITGVEE